MMDGDRSWTGSRHAGFRVCPARSALKADEAIADFLVYQPKTLNPKTLTSNLKP